MTKDDLETLRLGREVLRMIHSLRNQSGGETGYARRNITFPGGAVHLFIVNDGRLADIFDAAAEQMYEVKTVIPNTEVN